MYAIRSYYESLSMINKNRLKLMEKTMKTLIKTAVMLGLLVNLANSTSLKDAVVSTMGKNPDILSEKLNRDAYQKYIA